MFYIEKKNLFITLLIQTALSLFTNAFASEQSRHGGAAKSHPAPSSAAGGASSPLVSPRDVANSQAIGAGVSSVDDKTIDDPLTAATIREAAPEKMMWPCTKYIVMDKSGPIERMHRRNMLLELKERNTIINSGARTSHDMYTAFYASLREQIAKGKIMVPPHLPPFSQMHEREKSFGDAYQTFYSAYNIGFAIAFQVYSIFQGQLSLENTKKVRVEGRADFAENVEDFKCRFVNEFKRRQSNYSNSLYSGGGGTMTPEEVASFQHNFDHNPDIRTQLISAVHSIFDGNEFESALHFYLENRSVGKDMISSVWKRFLSSMGLSDERIELYLEKLKILDPSIFDVTSRSRFKHGGIMQVFIHQSKVDALTYISLPYGIPVGEDVSVNEFLNHFRKKSLLGDDKHWYKTALEKIGVTSAMDNHPQIRLLATAPDFMDSSFVKIFFYYDPDDQRIVDQFLSDEIMPLIIDDVEILAHRYAERYPKLDAFHRQIEAARGY